MTLNKVDLPQPDGPITLTNSPGATVSDMPSTAVSTPSRVSNRLTSLSTTRMASAGAADDRSAPLCAVAAMAAVASTSLLRATRRTGAA